MSAKKMVGSARQLLVVVFALALTLISACGTLDVAVEESATDQGTPPWTSRPAAETPVTQSPEGEGVFTSAVAWYGTVHSIPGSTAAEADYLKLWHLAIWPKFGRAVGLAGIDPAVNAEIDRLRDQDIKATFWGDLACNVADYGDCQLRVERISPSDGGPQFEADRVEGWTGRVGRLPLQPGSRDELLYFVLDGPVIVLYGIAGDDPAIQAELARLAGQESQTEGGGNIRIWGELTSRVQPVTGTRIDVERLQILPS